MLSADLLVASHVRHNLAARLSNLKLITEQRQASNTLFKQRQNGADTNCWAVSSAACSVCRHSATAANTVVSGRHASALRAASAAVHGSCWASHGSASSAACSSFASALYCQAAPLAACRNPSSSAALASPPSMSGNSVHLPSMACCSAATESRHTPRFAYPGRTARQAAE